MIKFLVINAIAVVVYFVPVAYTEYSMHTCYFGNMGEEKTPMWKASASKINLASREAQLRCEKASKTPEKCFIIRCEKSFFAP